MWQRLECLGKGIKINVSDWNTSLVTFTTNMTVSVYSKAVVLLYHSTFMQYLNPPTYSYPVNATLACTYYNLLTKAVVVLPSV